MSTGVKSKIAIHCQYVYGIGHFVRTIELAKGLSRYFSVYILNGGESVPNLEVPKEINIIQIPAIYKEENAKYLSPVDPSFTIEECLNKRRIIINDTISDLKPEILITEHFPFGLLFKNEVDYLISRVKLLNPKVKIVCSVRDIIESANGGKYDDITIELINKWYDLILIHGDDNYSHLKNTFPKFNEILVQTYHTGYIVKTVDVKTNKNNPIPIILASIAGGRLGKELLEALIDNHLLLKNKIKHKLVLFTGAFETNFEELKQRTLKLNSDDIKLHVFDREIYLNYFAKADLVITLGGYNSIIESISNYKRILVYQREFTQGNQEQDLRINLFKNLGLLKVICRTDLKPKVLTELITQSLKNDIIEPINIKTNGVKCSVELIFSLYNSK
jgi:predicted glycosyltransferase